MNQIGVEPLAVGREALLRGEWDKARTAFQDSVQQEETAEGLEGLGLAGWWLDDPGSIDARERAYRLYRDRGDRRGAARMALWLNWDYSAFKGESAVANGWLQRAERLLNEIDPVPEHGMLAIRKSIASIFRNSDPVSALRMSSDAVKLCRSLGVIDLEVLALSLEGLALVSVGRVQEGMRCLDEVGTAIVSGELHDPVNIGLSFCYLIFACDRVRDYDRAAEWCEKLAKFCEQWRLHPLSAVCRMQYAGVLIWRGTWPEAETELEKAADTLNASRPGMTVQAIARLAELRHRQGRTDEAMSMLDQAMHFPDAQLVRAELALDEGDGMTAVELADRFLRRIHAESRAERATGLELRIRATTALGDLVQAKESLSELQFLAREMGTKPLNASVNFAEGIVATAAQDHHTARRCFEDAMDLFHQCGTPFEAARARIGLARALCALDRRDIAEQEALMACESLLKIGAIVEAARASALVHEVKSAGDAGAKEGSLASILTQRERQVLGLIQQGLTNPEIAGKLFISGHTVHRHVTNILSKLDLSSRAAAAAFAARHGLT